MHERVALVTGASGGIGRATVEAFAHAGWQALAVDRRSGDGFPQGIRFHMADVSDPDSVQALFEDLRTGVGRLDALVNNAAIQICKPLIDTTVEEWDAVMASNLRSIFLTVRSAYDLLRAARGAVVNVSSVHAIATSSEIAAYAASKGGALALTRAMAIEFAPQHIRVNVVLPGAVDTGMLRAGLSREHAGAGTIEERLDNLGRKTVMGRIGTPQEIARAILFLADGEQSGFMTGQSMVVDGGATIRLSTE